MTDRNDPCPCGSGKKYKKCCMAKEVPFPQGASRSVELRQTGKLMDGIMTWEPEAILRCDELFLDQEIKESLRRCNEEDPDLCQDILGAFNEASLAELSRAGLFLRYRYRLTPHQLAYVEELALRTLRLWDVLEAAPGFSLRLRDVDTGEEVTVSEQSASRELSPGTRFAARVVYDAPQPTMSYALGVTAPMEERARSRALRFPAGREREVALEREIVREYLRESLLPSDSPKLVDAATGGLLEFVRDRFTVMDRIALLAAFNACEEIEKDQEVEEGWIRLQVASSGALRPIANLTLSDDMLEMLSRSREAGEANRKWLKALVGTAVKFRSSRVIDPEDLLGEGMPPPGQGSGAAIPMDERMAQMAYRHMYDDWGDAPLPMFGGRTPREHARTAKGRREVLDLVRQYQENDRRMAREQGRDPVDLSWVAGLAGLDPSEV